MLTTIEVSFLLFCLVASSQQEHVTISVTSFPNQNSNIMKARGSGKKPRNGTEANLVYVITF